MNVICPKCYSDLVISENDFQNLVQCPICKKNFVPADRETFEEKYNDNPCLKNKKIETKNVSKYDKLYQSNERSWHSYYNEHPLLLVRLFYWEAMLTIIFGILFPFLALIIEFNHINLIMGILYGIFIILSAVIPYSIAQIIASIHSYMVKNLTLLKKGN